VDIADLLNPITYEKRLVIFFDVMGWKIHVTAAGNDPEKVGQLALIPRLLKSLPVLQAAGSGEARITSFSDCCVISLPYKREELSRVIYGLSNVFVGAACAGFLLRAGVTVGDIHQDNDLVFGPALNVAHALESNGMYPRIVLDENIPELTDVELVDGMLGKDEFGSFIDPYTLSFLKSDYMRKDSIPDGTVMGLATDKAVTIYTILHFRLRDMLNKAQGEKAKKQVGWLYARVRNQFNKIHGG